MRIPIKIVSDDDRGRDSGPAVAGNWEQGENEDMSAKRKNQRPPAEERITAGQEDLQAEAAAVSTPAGGNGGRAVSRDLLQAEAEPPDAEKKYVRLLADFENYKRHAIAERERLSGLGKEAVLEDVFPMVGHLERAIRAAKDAGGKENDAILAGLEMVYRELLSVLLKHGVERVPTVGQPFDPKLHEAVAVVKRPGVAENTVLEEVQPGFQRNGKLLRPASVVVAQ